MGGDVNNLLEQKRSKKVITNKAIELGLKCEKYAPSNFWTEEEDSILAKYFPTIGSDCVKYLNKTKKQIWYRAKKLGLSYGKNRAKKVNWTEEEDNIIINNYENGVDYCLSMLKGRDKRALIRRASQLKISYKKRQSNYRYVYPNNGRWFVSLNINGKNLYFGYYDDEDEAGRVAMEKAKEYGKVI